MSSPMVGAAVLFAFMWMSILTCGLLLYRWLWRVDRNAREGKPIPFERGL